MRSVYWGMTALAGFAVGAEAMIMRHDVSDARYRALGEQYRDTVVDVAILDKAGKPRHGNGAGTLVAADWVLTAAHVARHVKPGHQVFVAERPYTVAEVVIHPDRTAERPWVDVALLKLAAPVVRAKPACLYGGRDEVGKTTTMVGRGHSGNGLTGPTGKEPLLRGATVQIQGADEEHHALWWRFRAPGESGVTPLEGISGPGDSGGPAFLMDGKTLCIAGVSAAQDDEGRGEGRYGVKEYYPRVSHYRPWILSVMKGTLGERG